MTVLQGIWFALPGRWLRHSEMHVVAEGLWKHNLVDRAQQPYMMDGPFQGERGKIFNLE